MSQAQKLSKMEFSIRILSGPDEGSIYQLVSNKVTLGRSPENDISFIDDPKMSRKHAVISIEAGDPRVTDISGKNFILVDGEKCKEAFIANGSKVQLGNTVLEFQIAESSKEKPSGNSVAVPELQVAGGLADLQKQAREMRHPRPEQMLDTMPIERDMMNPGGGGYSPPGIGLPSAKNQKPPKAKKIIFYTIVALFLAMVYLVASGPGVLTNDKLQIRSNDEILKEQEASEKRVEALKMQKTQLGTDTRQYDEAQASYIRCFRDYQQGQFTRAIQHCQAALSIFPNHELAERYLLLSQRKRDERMQFLTRKGKLYLERGYYSRCMATLTQVMYDLKSPNHPLFQEARQIHSECRTLQEGRY